MNSPSRDHAPTPRGVRSGAAATVTCDLCGWPMAIPTHCIESGEIAGLLTCSECVEDALATRQLEMQP
jgi:hypothetical protein